MLRIVVFDGGLGGELVADYLASELDVVEIVREIDWQHAPYEDHTEEEIFEFASTALEPYIGYAELIVLGGYTSSLALERLRQAYPEQTFVGMSIDYRYILNVCRQPEQVMFMASEVVLESQLWTKTQDNLRHLTLIAPDCSNWEWQLDCGHMTSDVLRSDLSPYFALTPPSTEQSDPSLSLATQFVYAADADFADREPKTTPLRKQIIQFLGRDFQSRSNLAFAAAGMDDFISPVPSEPAPQNIVPVPATAKTNSQPVLLHPDTIVLLDTHFWALRDELQALFGYGVRIVDFRKQLLHTICRTLKLKGLDGNLTCQF